MFKNKHLNRLLKAAPVALIALGLTSVAIAPAHAGDVASWQKSVVNLISKKQVYPRAALASAIEGKAKVKVTIDRAGAIKNFEVVQPAGNALLDDEVPKLMSRINPLPAPPAELPDANLTFVLPLSWALE